MRLASAYSTSAGKTDFTFARGMDATGEVAGLLIGKRVEAHEFTRAELNGTQDIVLSYDEEKGGCAGQFGTAASVLIKPTNLPSS